MTSSDLPFASVANLAQAIATRQTSSSNVVAATLQRIQRLDPSLGAFLAVNPRLLAEARAADRAVAAGRQLGPLHGVPISLKDLILTRGMPTTAGSKAFTGRLPANRNAPLVRRLRRAGALLLGKTNLHEIAMGVTTVNEHFGPARNPWDTARVAGGSSGGSAVAVAAGLGAGSIGTDTRGSIRIPAACCGITGLKPTLGLVSTEDVIPLSWTLDHAGPMTRSVEDAAILLAALTGRSRDARTWQAALTRPVTGLRVGVCDYYLDPVDPVIRSAVQEAIAAFGQSGCALRPITIRELDGAQAASAVITGAEAIAYHDQTLRDRPEGYGPMVRQRLERGYDLKAIDLARAERKRLALIAAFDEVFREVDLLIGASIAVLPPRIEDRAPGLLDAFTRLNSPQNMAGLPALVLPCGMSPEGLPLAMQMIAARGREDVLFAAGAHWQRETDWHQRRPPGLE
jgi:aspartyl-tRNA(Asn)/glutamyl-tRNA(Gln) amidotransferase subunit A